MIIDNPHEHLVVNRREIDIWESGLCICSKKFIVDWIWRVAGRTHLQRQQPGTARTPTMTVYAGPASQCAYSYLC